MKIAHGHHASFTRNIGFPNEEACKNPQLVSSSKDISFISSKSSKIANKFLQLSIVTSKITLRNSVDRSTGLETEGLSRGDFDCPESEDEETSPCSKGKSLGNKEMDYEVVLSEFKCKECGNKAEGVCMKCLLTRFCSKCFEKLHQIHPTLKNEHHVFTYYKKEGRNETRIQLFSKSPRSKKNKIKSSLLSSKKY